MGLIFYDTETTGTETFFDQILQFAAIKTDENLREVDRFEIRSRLQPHIVPAPRAVLVTGVKVSQLTDTSLPSHYEMVRSLQETLASWSPALFIGWNSIQFDEDLIRQALYKTLHNPYLTNRDGNSRTDAMRMAQACSVFACGALTIPTDKLGKKIFRLEDVALGNGFRNGHAHDAMADVEATLFLCRVILEKAPDVWSSFMRFSSKAAVASFITEEPTFCLSDFYFGQPFSWICTTLGQNDGNSAEWYVYNLEIDPSEILPLCELDLVARLTDACKI